MGEWGGVEVWGGGGGGEVWRYVVGLERKNEGGEV